jgi:hypothetical protein
MNNELQNAPEIDGLTFIFKEPVAWIDERARQIVVFPIYHYINDANDNLVLVTDCCFQPLLDEKIARGDYAYAGDAI